MSQGENSGYQRGVRMSRYSDRAMARVGAKFTRGGPDECWIWHGYVGVTSKAQIKIDGRQLSGRRIIWEVENNEELPREMNLIGTCGNPRCVNPAHVAVVKKGQRLKDVRPAQAPWAVRRDVYDLAWMVGYDLVRALSGRLRVVKL